MPIYEYRGQQYNIATDDPAAAKAKILSYLGPQGATPAQKPAAAPSDDYDFGSPMGTGSEEIMAAAKPAPVVAPKFVKVKNPAPYKNRVEMLDDAVNLLEEGVDRADIQQSLQQSGVKWEDVVKHGQRRGSEYFKQQAPVATPAVGPVPRPAGTQEMKAIPETEFLKEPGVWTGEATSKMFKRVDAGMGDVSTSYLMQFGVLDPDSAGRLLARNAKQRAAAAPSADIRAGMEEIGNAETYGDAISAMATNPRATFTMLVESVATSLPAMAPAMVLGPAGVMVRSTAAGLSSGAVEYGSVMADVLQDKRVNMLDANAVSKALSDPKIIAEIKDKGAKRGLIVGLFDGLSMGIAGRFLKPAQALIAEGKLAGTAAKKATMAAWGKELATQMGGGAGGELAAQKATGENKPAAVLMEALAEGFTAPLEARANLREAQLAEQQAAVNADLAAPPAPPVTPPAAPAPSSAVQADQARADKIAALTDVYTKQGIPADNAGRIATRKVDAALKGEAKTAAIKVPEGRVEEITQDLIAAGIPPEQAKIDAQNLAQEEVEADELASTETRGAENVAQPVGEPSGAGVSVAGQPGTEPTAAGAGVTEPSGVVPTGQDVANAPAGAEVQPAPLNPWEQAVRTVEEGIATGKTRQEILGQLGELHPAELKYINDHLTEVGIKEEPTDEEQIQAEDESIATYDAKKAKAQQVARTNVQAAFDQVGEYGSIDEALDSYRANTADTLAEEGFKKDADWDALLDVADRAFDAEVAKLKGPSEATAPTEAVTGTPSWVSAGIWDLHEKSQKADAEALHWNANHLKANATKASNRLVRAVAALFPGDDQAQLALMVRMNEESTRREAAKEFEQEAAPTKATAPGKRGRPTVKQTHVVVPSAGGFDHVTNGEVVATYKNKKQATAAVDLAKSKDKGNAELIAKNQAKLDEALASQGRGRPAKAVSEEGTVEVDKETKVELNALESALETYNSPDSDKTSVANAAMYISDAATDATLPKPARERAAQMLEEDVDPKDIPKKLRSTAKNVGKADTGFSKVANGVQAATYIAKNGNAFQRFVAERIRNFLVGVKFIVVERGDAAESEMEGARGLFVYDAANKTRTVYVRGASFGDAQGINNITVLHELLHAATAMRIEASLIKGFANFELKRFKREMQDLAKRAEREYKELTYLDMVDEDLNELVSNTHFVDKETGEEKYEIFSSPHEFLAYGMSSPEFQKFLMRIKGKQAEATGFTAFVNSIRDLFGIKAGDATAFTDLVNITDKMLNTRVEPIQMKTKLLQQAGKFTPPEFDEKADLRAKRSALALERAARKAKQKVAESREGDLATAVEAMQKERDPSKVREILANAWSWMDYKQREAMVRLPTFDFLAKWAAEKGITALTQTNLHLEHMLGMSQQFLVGAEQIVGMLDRGFKEDPSLSRKSFEDLVYATTVAEIDPSDPNATERSKTLDADYKALGPVGQRMYKNLRDYYESIIELYSDLLDEQIQNAAGLTQEDKNSLMAMLRKTFEAKARIHPYFPLVRRGDFWLAIGTGEARRFYTFESRIDRNNKAAELAAHKGDDVEDLLFRQEFTQGNDLGSLRTASKDSSKMLKETFDAIDKMEMGEDSGGAKEGLKDAVYQIYLNTMPEQTFRKQFTHRKNRTGFSTDVRQNVATTAAKQATQLARLKYAPLLRNSLSGARDAIREREEMSPFVQEAEKRVNMALSGSGGGLGESIAGVANKASFFWYLSGASSALIQPSSIFISGLPVLAGNYGSATGAAAELSKMTLLVNQYSVLRTNSDGSTSISAPSIANSKSLPADERKAVSEMVSRGVSQSTYASMVWGYKQTPTESMYFGLDKGLGNIPVAYGKGKRMASFLVGALMHNTERLSREAVYLAAYRLGKKQGLSYGDAVQKAVDSTNEALGNYDITNKPRFMQEGIGKVAFQFKMYPLQMTLLMLTNFKNMLPFLNKEGKREAATKFFGMMGTSGLLAGASGMALFSPIMGLVGWAWGKMGDDDDDWPKELKDLDFQTWFRTVFLPEHLGDVKIGGVPVSDIIDRGPLNAITGYDIASRVGLNDLWGRDSKETKTSRDSAIAFMLDHFAGPTASLLLGFSDAYDSYAMGDYQKMQEKLAPAAIRNLLVAQKYADEGMKTGRGIELVGKDDVKTGELIGQAVGFRPDILAAVQGPSFKLSGVEQRILNQRGLLLNKLDFQLRQNTDKGDERFEKILDDEVSKFNTKFPSYALDSDTIYNSLTKKAEQRATSRAGVAVTEKNIPLVEEATDTMERILDRRAAEMKAQREKNPR